MKQYGKRLLLTLALLTSASMLLWTSCKTWPPAPSPEQTPSVSWPIFPDPTGQVEKLPDGRVAVTFDLWLALTRYAVDVEAVREVLDVDR